ncbi:MAG: integrin alpha [Phycisphaerales bacterium]
MVKHHLISNRAIHTFMALIALLPLASIAHGLYQPDRNESNAGGTVLSHQKISDTEGGFTGILDNDDWFGWSAAGLGDLDGDGVGDLAVGAFRDDDGGTNRGAVWILFLNPDGTVKTNQKISSTHGGFTGILDNFDSFGSSVAALGDLDGDGVDDLAVGAPTDDDGGKNRGAVWLLFLNADGTVKSHQKISSTEGAFTGMLDHNDAFGGSVAGLGDLDGDGVSDLAVGAWGDSDGGTPRGAVWILFLNSDGTVQSHQKISDTEGGFTGILDYADGFGSSVAWLGDHDGDGVGDLAVGAPGDDDGSAGPCDNPVVCNRGAVWILFLTTDGTVKTHQKISDTRGNLTGILNDGDGFGSSAASLGDLDGDGVGDLAVGVPSDDDGGNGRGAVWMLFLNTDGTVKTHQKISDTEGGFTGTLDDGDGFAISVASLGDHDGDGVGDLTVGAFRDDDGDTNRGAVWVLFLNGICLWDLDASGSIGASDLLSLLVSWGPCKGCPADFDGDGSVGASDLLALLVNWGPCP